MIELNTAIQIELAIRGYSRTFLLGIFLRWINCACDLAKMTRRVSAYSFVLPCLLLLFQDLTSEATGYGKSFDCRSGTVCVAKCCNASQVFNETENICVEGDFNKTRLHIYEDQEQTEASSFEHDMIAFHTGTLMPERCQSKSIK